MLLGQFWKQKQLFYFSQLFREQTAAQQEEKERQAAEQAEQQAKAAVILTSMIQTMISFAKPVSKCGLHYVFDLYSCRYAVFKKLKKSTAV